MNRTQKLELIPTAAAILYAIFLGLFATDEPIFSSGFFMHLIPSLLVLATTFIFRTSKKATAAWIILAIAFTLFFNTYREAIGFALITGPLLLIAGLSYFLAPKEN